MSILKILVLRQFLFKIHKVSKNSFFGSKVTEEKCRRRRKKQPRPNRINVRREIKYKFFSVIEYIETPQVTLKGSGKG